MKSRFLILVAMSALALSSCATEGSRHPAGGPKGGASGGGRPESPPANRNQGPPRTQGTVVTQHPGPVARPPQASKPTPPHQVVIHDGEPPRSVVDNRPPSVISRDPHARVMVRASFHPIPAYARFHPVIRPGIEFAWWGTWGIDSWDTVGTVTCEATNASTGELYPVTAERDRNGWDDVSINDLLDQAMDDCSNEAAATDNGVDPCIPATPSCSFDSWDGRYPGTN
jgi:hypothetical protein